MPDSRIVCYVEREAQACEILVKNIEAGRLDDAPIWSDADTFDSSPWCGLVDWIIGGPPCQPFSGASYVRLGAGDSRNQWPTTLRITEEVTPQGLFFENVPSKASLTYIHDHVLPRLRELDYRVETGIFSASEVGAPHQRKRIFILATDSKRKRAKGLVPREDPSLLRPWRWSGKEDLRSIASAPLERGDRWPQPIIRGVDDGMAYRMDRIHLIGNGVVPLQAALAFQTLYQR